LKDRTTTTIIKRTGQRRTIFNQTIKRHIYKLAANKFTGAEKASSRKIMFKIRRKFKVDITHATVNNYLRKMLKKPRRAQKTFVITSDYKEQRLELIYPLHLEGKIISALKSAHEYQEVAHFLTPISNIWKEIGAGAVGTLKSPKPLIEFLDDVKEKLGIDHLKYYLAPKHKAEMVSKIAVGGGTCSFLIGPAKAAGADVLLTADLKYHEWFDGEDALSIVDVGHYESEKHVIDFLARFISEKLPNIAVRLTTVITNPVKHH
jgi:putative NIF3 family GTP cyclohydrolase 1 type 2